MNIIADISYKRTFYTRQRSHHVSFDPPSVAGVCDSCNTDLIQRDDDTEITVRNRLSVYDQMTAPLKAYYEEAGLLRSINGCGSIQEIQNQVDMVFEGVAGDHP